jgi:O-antigen ligase
MRNAIVNNSQINTRKYWFIIILIGILVSLSFLVAASQGKKWLIAMSMGIIGIFMSFILHKDIKHLFLILAVFLIPIRIDFYIGFKRSDFIQTGYPGLPVTAFDLLLVGLFIYFLFQVLRGKEKFEFYPALSVPAILYILLTGISAFHSFDRTLSLSNFLLIIKSYIVFLFFVNRIKTKNDITLVAVALIFAVAIQCVVGGLQYITGGALLKGVFGIPDASFVAKAAGSYILSRVGGTIGHPNALAKYLCFCITILLGYRYAKINKHISRISMPTILFGGILLLLTMSRGSWVALGLSFIFIFYYLFRHFFRSRAKAIAAVLLLNIVMIFFIFLLFENVRQRLFEDDYGRAMARIPMARVALNIIKKYPLTGIGLNNYTHVMQQFDRTREWQTYKFQHPVHNSYLLIAAESGIPALAAFLWLVGALFVKTRSAFKRIDMPLAIFQIGCLSGVLTWLISGMFDRDLAGLYEMLWFTMALAIAANRMLEHTAEDKGVI